jgi:hypothetical protein
MRHNWELRGGYSRVEKLGAAPGVSEAQQQEVKEGGTGGEGTLLQGEQGQGQQQGGDMQGRQEGGQQGAQEGGQQLDVEDVQLWHLQQRVGLKELRLELVFSCGNLSLQRVGAGLLAARVSE